MISRLCGLGFVLLLGIAACSEEKFVEGRVVDYETGEAVAAVQVTAHQVGWDLWNFQWDRTYLFQTQTDADGRFHLPYDVGTSAHLKTQKDGYVPRDAWFAPGSSIVLPLKRRNPAYTPPKHGFLEIGFRNSEPYGWIFAENRTTTDPERADLFPALVSQADFIQFTLDLRAPGRGGVLFLPGKTLGVVNDWLVFADQAPETGYRSAQKLGTDRPGGVYFVRTGRGDRYAQLEFNPNGFSLLGSQEEFRSGNWSLWLEYVYNETGSRNLEFERADEPGGKIR